MKRGEDWGEPSPVPDDAISVSGDKEARHLVADARRAGKPLPRLHLAGGDLARSLGGGGVMPPTNRASTRVRVDIGAVLIDGRLDWFIAHLIVRDSWLRGRVVVVANGDFVGKWNVAPRAHPGDGLLDLIDSDLSLSDRFKARSRLQSGTHLPHPGILSRRAAAFQIDLEHPTTIRLDGESAGRASRLSVRTEPAALDIWI